MARPTKNKADWFQHDADLSNDHRSKYMLKKYGLAGYGLLNLIFEHLTRSDNYNFTIYRKSRLIFLSVEFYCDKEVNPDPLHFFLRFLGDCSEVGFLEIQNNDTDGSITISSPFITDKLKILEDKRLYYRKRYQGQTDSEQNSFDKETPVSNIETPVSNIETPDSNIETPVSNIENTHSNINTHTHTNTNTKHHTQTDFTENTITKIGNKGKECEGNQNREFGYASHVIQISASENFPDESNISAIEKNSPDSKPDSQISVEPIPLPESNPEKKKEKTSAQKEKTSHNLATEVHTKCHDIFTGFYQDHKKTPYLGWGAKDAAHLKLIIGNIMALIRSHGKDPDAKNIPETFSFMLQKLPDIPDRWVYDHLSVANFSSKFNEITDQIINKKNGNRNAKAERTFGNRQNPGDDFLDDILSRLNEENPETKPQAADKINKQNNKIKDTNQKVGKNEDAKSSNNSTAKETALREIYERCNKRNPRL